MPCAPPSPKLRRAAAGHGRNPARQARRRGQADRISKANAVCELMKHAPFADRNPIFIGDDTTDEPVFGIISQFGGLGFSVGRVVPNVNGHFDKPESVRAWLARIANKAQSTAQ